MKKNGLKFLMGALLIAFASSCLNDDNDYKDPTHEEEQAKLKAYIDALIANGNNMDTTALGVYYVRMKEGTGDFAQPGDTLTVGYAGYFINGYMFDASVLHNRQDSTYTFVLEHEEQRMVKGFEDGMKMMNKGSKVQLIIPSEFAYGSGGRPGIPPYTSLVFVIEMKKIQPLTEN